MAQPQDLDGLVEEYGTTVELAAGVALRAAAGWGLLLAERTPSGGYRAQVRRAPRPDRAAGRTRRRARGRPAGRTAGARLRGEEVAQHLGDDLGRLLDDEVAGPGTVTMTVSAPRSRTTDSPDADRQHRVVRAPQHEHRLGLDRGAAAGAARRRAARRRGRGRAAAR